MKTEDLEIRTADGLCDAHVAYPDAPESSPGVLLYMDAFGLRPRRREMAARLASHGYYVLAPNVFYRTKRSPVFDLKVCSTCSSGTWCSATF